MADLARHADRAAMGLDQAAHSAVRSLSATAGARRSIATARRDLLPHKLRWELREAHCHLTLAIRLRNMPYVAEDDGALSVARELQTPAT
jgi:hypothetical protein